MYAQEYEHSSEMKVLVVEDEETIRNLYDAVLKKEGHKTVMAATGKEAIEMSDREDCDLVILDLKMPDIQGIDVLKHIRKKNEDIVVIIVTGYPSLDTALNAIKSGVYDYIIKPVSVVQLKMVIKRAIEKVSLVRENKILLGELKKKNERLEENVNELENIANAAMAREKSLESELKALKGEGK